MMRRMSFVGVAVLVLAVYGCRPDNGGPDDAAGPVDGAAGVDADGSSGLEDGGTADVADGGDEGDDADARPPGGDADSGPADGESGDAGDVDAGPSCQKDSDGDGLPDCEEAELCTDPHDADTDGDHLGDLEEFQMQTDPCSKDTDNDGANDYEEIQYGLDPNDQSTYDDGKLDGERWILEACEEPVEAEPVDFHKSSPGNWTIALPPAFNNYTNLTLSEAPAPQAGALYDDPANEVAGALLSRKPDGEPGPESVLRGAIRNTMGTLGTVEDGRTGGEFMTHDDKRAAIGRYLIETPQASSVRKFREQLLLSLAPFTKADASGWENTKGAKYRRFRVFFSVIYRSYTSRDQVLISMAIAPDSKYEARQSVKFRMDDLSNTTNIAEEVDSHLPRCQTFEAGEETPKAEFYWVLDQSGSMRDDNQKVADFSSQFEEEVRNTSIDYRLGITNMDLENDGRLRLPPSWHSNSSTFSSEIEEAVINCGGFGSAWGCDGAAEHGLEVAYQGLEYMKGLARSQPKPAERFRSDAQTITIFMTDEEANCIKHGNERECRPLSAYKQFFPQHTIAFSIVGDGDDCGSDDGEAYKEVALETGGKFASLCAEDLTQTIRDIIFAATGITSNYVLPQTPISSSLRVYLNGQWVPRSRKDGFEYFAKENAIAFFGSWRPSKRQNEGQDFVAVSYETFKDREKCGGDQQTSQDCNPWGDDDASDGDGEGSDGPD